jgi:exosortase
MSRVLTASTAPATTRSPWPWLIAPAAAAFVVYAPVVPLLVNEWMEFPSLSHGLAVPFIAGYLAWARRDRLTELVPTPSLWGLPLLIMGLAALVLGVLGDESFIARISLPITLFGVVLFVGGYRVVLQLAPAIGYLFFMIPLPWSTMKLLTYRSRIFDATVSTWLVRWLDVPVLQDGVNLQLPNITLVVADECSSVPAIAALVALAMAYVAFSRRPRGHALIVVAAALPLAVLSNIIRLVTVIAGVYYIGPVTLKSFYHAFSGTVNFLFTLLLLMALDALLNLWWRRRTA